MNATLILRTLFVFFLPVTQIFGQCVPVTSTDTYTQNFNALALSGTSSVVPPGWAFAESGTNANPTYTAGTGSATGGETYSLGAAGNPERAFGSVRSASLITMIGGCFANATGGQLGSALIAYTGEQWRLGALGRVDRMIFEYSTDATSLTTGTWTPVAALNFNSPVTAGSTGSLDGNAAANRTSVSAQISSLNAAAGANFWIRWTDTDASGSDDALALDDFSLAAVTSDSDVDLTIGRETSALSVGAGETATYTLKAANRGTSSAAGVRAVFKVPEGYVYVEAIPAGTFTAVRSGGLVNFDGGTLAGGEAQNLTVVLQAAATGARHVSFGADTVIDPDNTIAETNEANNRAVDDLEIRFRFRSPVAGTAGRPSLAALLGEIDEIGIDAGGDGEKIVRLDRDLTGENADVVVPGDLTIDFGPYRVGGAGRFSFGRPSLNFGPGTGAGFRTVNVNGLGDEAHAGSLQMKGGVVFNGATDAAYDGAAAQTAYGMPPVVGRFEIDNPAGLTLAAPLTVLESLDLTDGVIKNGAQTITIGENARNNGADAGEGRETSYVSGRIEKIMRAPAGRGPGEAEFYVFPVGTLGGPQAGYSPLKASYGQSGAGAALTVEVFDTSSPGLGVPSLSRYWQLTETGEVNADLEFRWRAGDDEAIRGGMILQIYRGVVPACAPASMCSVDLAARTASISNVSDFSPWTVGALVPTTALVEAGGRVTNAAGRPVPNAIVAVIDQHGAERTARTNNFGRYRLSGLAAGGIYVFSVKSRGRAYAPQLVTVGEDVFDLNFRALE